VTISTIRGSFYADSSYGNGAFDIDPSTPPVFSALYPTLNFNPPTGAQENCSNQTNVNEQTRPFYAVIPQSDGSCTVQAAAGDDGHGHTVYAGQTGGPLEAFEAVFTATLTVAQPGQVTFNVFSDDGWTLAVGSDGASHQPTYLSGSMDNALGTSFANPIQPVAGTDPQRQIVFVHGINGNTRDISQPGGDYSGLLGPLQVLYPSRQVHIFSYFQDRAYSDANNPPLASAPPCIQKQSPPTDYSSLIPEQLGTVNDNVCDSQPDLGLNAALLSDSIAATTNAANHVAIIAHSMGGATTRGYLALVERAYERTGVDPSANVDTVVTFQGAQQGAFGARVAQGLALSGALDAPIYGPILNGISSHIGFDLNRPAVTELTPQSDWYNNINATRVPAHIHYFNIYSNIHTRIVIALPFHKHLAVAPIDWGDFVMRPGSDNPRDTPFLGGARFRPDPATVASSYEWLLYKPHDILFNPNLNPFDSNPQGQAGKDVLAAFNDPASHFALSGHLDELSYQGSSVAVPDCVTGQASSITLQIEHALANPAHACP